MKKIKRFRFVVDDDFSIDWYKAEAKKFWEGCNNWHTKFKKLFANPYSYYCSIYDLYLVHVDRGVFELRVDHLSDEPGHYYPLSTRGELDKDDLFAAGWLEHHKNDYPHGIELEYTRHSERNVDSLANILAEEAVTVAIEANINSLLSEEKQTEVKVYAVCTDDAIYVTTRPEGEAIELPSIKFSTEEEQVKAIVNEARGSIQWYRAAIAYHPHTTSIIYRRDTKEALEGIVKNWLSKIVDNKEQVKVLGRFVSKDSPDVRLIELEVQHDELLGKFCKRHEWWKSDGKAWSRVVPLDEDENELLTNPQQQLEKLFND